MIKTFVLIARRQLMQPKRLFLIEFNELCPSLLQHFMAQGLLPNFRRFYETSTVATTTVDEEHPNLEPWIQWPSVHSGMTFAEHGIFHLGDGRKFDKKCLAELLSDAGVRVGVCGSMNTNYGRLNGYVIPDPWDKEGEAYPQDLARFSRTVARQVQESSKGSGLSLCELLSFGWFLVNNGLTGTTTKAILQQLWSERRDPGLRWRRACLLDMLQYDVFRSLNRRHDVRFATFFCNSTAHFQHYYWRNMEPSRFDAPPPASDHPSLADAILTGYLGMDQLLGRFLADSPDALLVLCTALSQQPWTETTKCTYRPRSFGDLLAFAGLPTSDVEIKPVMAEQFHVICRDGATADTATDRFRALTFNGLPLLAVEREGNNLFVGCQVMQPTDLELTVTRSDGATCRFGDLFYMIHTMRSGRHHPDGVLWLRTGDHRVLSEKVPLTDIAPTVLSHFGVEAPDHMNGRPILLETPTQETPAPDAPAFAEVV
jgi:hypothetical protein